ncbi:efflux transporter outer membrane subunit [Paraburkholderia sp. SIMBA_054]|uniref:efflux transporter outer membrane subunit n=2 Tax=Bacteria TaxID=2 RepID=UPI003978AC3D
MLRFRLAIAWLLLLTALAGCSLVPAYHRPATPTPTQWDGADASSLAGTLPVESGWWRAYDDTTLDALVGRCLAHNFTLANAVATVDEARANAERAGAPLFPALTLNGTFQRGHNPTSNSSAGKQNLFAQASYEVDFWGLNRANASAADMIARASGFDRDTVALTLTASVADTYFQVQSLRRRVALAQAVADDASKLLTLVLAQQAVGVATELQVQQQRNALSTFNAAVPVLQQQLEQNMHLLATLVGEAPEQFKVPDVALGGITIPEPRPNLPATLLEIRPDIRAQEARLEAANFDVGAARAAFFPNLVLTAAGGFGTNSLSNFLSNPLGAVGASLIAPLFEGGALTGQLHMNQAAVRQAVANYRQTVIAAFQDVEDSLSAAAGQRQAEGADTDAADAARKAALLARQQYTAGTVDFLTVLDAERTRYQSEDTLAQARLARLQASVSLFRAFGGGYGASETEPLNANTGGSPQHPQTPELAARTPPGPLMEPSAQ